MLKSSANTNNANNVMNVTATGTTTNNNANNTYCSRPDCPNHPNGESAEYASAETTKMSKEHTACSGTMPDKPSAVTEASSDATCEGSLFYNNTIFTAENLINAAKECLKGCRWKDTVARWELNIISNCNRLEKEIRSGKYKLGKGHAFRITSPKERIVTAMLFRDRVVHKVICKSGGLIEDCFRNAYIDNCACQTGKGTTFAISRLRKHLADFNRRNGTSGYVVDIDVRKFFDSIPHDRLVDFVFRRVRSPLIRHIVADVIRSYPGDKGIGLGSEISQVLANAYLTSIDFYIKQRLGMRNYVRYADNMIILVPDEVKAIDENGDKITISGKDAAKTILSGVTEMLAKIGLDVNPKSGIYPLSRGVHFLGFRLNLSESGKIIQTVLSKSVRRMRRHTSAMVRLYRAGKRTKEQVVESFKSWAAYASKGMSNNRIKVLYDKLLEVLK